MSVVSSMATAISGLEANGQMLGVITDNIANANTNGFKTSRAEFQSVLAQDMGGSSGSQMGRGTRVAGITNLLTQGSVTRTDRPTDLAINGNGFFVLKGDKLGQTYTRDGSFRFDKEGWLTNLNGFRVQAYTADPSGKVTGELADVRIPYNTIPAKATKEIQLNVNLDARSPITQELDILRPAETAQYTTAMQVFDSVGNAHSVSFYFNKTTESGWDWYAMTDGANLVGESPGSPATIAQGTLLFNEQGQLLSSDQQVTNSNFVGAIPDQALNFNFGDPISESGTGQKGTTQYGSKNANFRAIQDGYSAGVLADTSISEDGLLTGVYTNGENRTLGQLAVARFEATERLSKAGENQFRETVESGQPLIGMANTNGRGVIMPGSIETSNVDLATEFVDMIKAQRGFQASAKSISSANEMLDEIINLKRT